MQRNAMKWLLTFSVTGVALLIAVVVLSVRLGGVTKKLKSAQAMSVSLQEELELAKQERGGAEPDPFGMKPPDKAAVANLTPALSLTVTPKAEATPGAKRYIVCVDAGHGDWDGGAVCQESSTDTRLEKEDNLWFSKLFRDAMEEYDVQVVMTRETDEFLELSERTAIANAINADVLISFHRNSYDGTESVNGAEVWIHNSGPEGAYLLAGRILAAVTEVGGMQNRGIKYGSISNPEENYVINREANMTSMIVELGFISSPEDNAAYDAYGEAYAREMARTVYEWLEEQNTENN